jgi:hypothetical protein
MVMGLGLKIHLYGKWETSQRDFSIGFPTALAYQAAPINLDEIRSAFVV